jgi:hypothetical protein
VGAGGFTVITVDCAALPPVPAQVSVYVVFAVSAGVACEPLSALVPDQPPDAAHEVAWVEDQVRVEVPPLAKVLGFAVSVTVGAGALTDTVTDWAAVPPGPVQVNV